MVIWPFEHDILCNSCPKLSNAEKWIMYIKLLYIFFLFYLNPTRTRLLIYVFSSFHEVANRTADAVYDVHFDRSVQTVHSLWQNRWAQIWFTAKQLLTTPRSSTTSHFIHEQNWNSFISNMLDKDVCTRESELRLGPFRDSGRSVKRGVGVLLNGARHLDASCFRGGASPNVPLGSPADERRRNVITQAPAHPCGGCWDQKANVPGSRHSANTDEAGGGSVTSLCNLASLLGRPAPVVAARAKLWSLTDRVITAGLLVEAHKQ